MVLLDDVIWHQMAAGYRIPYDASVPLRKMEAGENVWDELWNELHHQGDVGEASYAAVPQIVRIVDNWPSRDWNFYGLASVIEVERFRKTNPPLPTWLQSDYKFAWARISVLALRDVEASTDPLTIQSALVALILSKGERKLGALLTHFDTSEIDELAEERLAWSELYT